MLLNEPDPILKVSGQIIRLVILRGNELIKRDFAATMVEVGAVGCGQDGLDREPAQGPWVLGGLQVADVDPAAVAAAWVDDALDILRVDVGFY